MARCNSIHDRQVAIIGQALRNSKKSITKETESIISRNRRTNLKPVPTEEPARFSPRFLATGE